MDEGEAQEPSAQPLLHSPVLAAATAMPQLAAAAYAAHWGQCLSGTPIGHGGGGGGAGLAIEVEAVAPRPFAADIDTAVAAFRGGADHGAAAPPLARPAIPGQPVPVLPAASVPHPPRAVVPASYQMMMPPQPASVAAVLAASAAALQQAGLHPHQHQLLLQQHPSLFACLSPFALYASGGAYLP